MLNNGSNNKNQVTSSVKMMKNNLIILYKRKNNFNKFKKMQDKRIKHKSKQALSYNLAA